LIANGHADLMVEAGLQPFDYMALVAVVEAAGGCATSWSGERLTLASDGRLLIASDADLHAQARDVLRR
jgi:fructose-1,6-bisphosphatase/inositol monophosphatase family enzyme